MLATLLDRTYIMHDWKWEGSESLDLISFLLFSDGETATSMKQLRPFLKLHRQPAIHLKQIIASIVEAWNRKLA